MEPNFLAAVFLYVGATHLIDITREPSTIMFILKNIIVFLCFLLAVSI